MNKTNSEIIELCKREYTEKHLAVPIGKLNDDEYIYIDFQDVSGLFIAGTTGTGKSILIDDIIHGLMCKNKSSDINFCLIDPKKIELNEYNGLDYVVNEKSFSSLNDILDLLNYVDKLMDYRMNNKDISNWSHTFVIIDEGYDIINILDIRKILEKILKIGCKVGIHLIFSTNAYLKDLVKNEFISKFKYKITFDLSSSEQARLLGIRNSNWLSGEGDAIIKSFGSKNYRFKALKTSDDEINNVILYSNEFI